MNDIMIGGVSMYFPILKGGIFELSALTELLVNKRLNDKIIPIIEPVKITPTLLKTLELFVENNREIAIIFNSQRCDFNCLLKEMILENSTVAKALATVMKIPYIIKAYIMNENIELEIKHKADKKNYIIIIESADSLSSYLEVYEDCCPRYTFIPNDKPCKRIVSGNRISLDSFLINHLNHSDEFISDMHSYYDKREFDGFTDYAVIKEFSYIQNCTLSLVVIHFVYFDLSKNISIHNFSSDFSEDPKVNFKEAMQKLIEWKIKNKVYETQGLKMLLRCYQTGSYPGLGLIKMYSIMNYLELIWFLVE